MKPVINFLTVVALGLGLAAGVQAQAPDVGLVNLIQGDVSYQSDGAQTAKAQAYMKVRQGDRFSVPAGAQVRVVYLQGGRQETWSGPSAFRAGAQQSEATNGQPTGVSQLPAAVTQKLEQAPVLIQVARMGRAGAVPIRGKLVPQLLPAQKVELGNAQNAYKTLRAQAAADDVMPEMYLFSVLQDLQLYEDAKSVVEDMTKRQPDNADLKAMLSYVNWRLSGNP